MRHELAKSAVAALAVAWVLCGCFDDPDGDLDPGGDLDSDTDTDIDSDSDTDADAECGEIDAECCESIPACAAGLTGVHLAGGGCACFLPCAPDHCTDDLDLWGGSAVPCYDVSDGSGIGACFADEDFAPVEECPTEICTTPSGYTDGICLSDGVNDYCMRRCEPQAGTCDGAHSCGVVLDVTDDLIAGVCLPN
ncbi:MAG: hypothetical protein M0R80_16270 [Proteobacteria bacterium]|jgi:hypothetical protein|nr:hypothetical protein [Pseudomonadota bacterium]